MNPVIKEALRTLLRRAHHAKQTRQWTLLRETTRRIRYYWRMRHMTHQQAIRRLQGA